MNTLLWGLFLPDTPVNIYNFDNKFWTYINYYRLSIKTASDLGYDCHFYINKEVEKYFDDLNVTLHIIDELNHTFYDSINFYIFETEHKDKLILDGDIILRKRLPEIEADVVYEMKETNSWEWLYEFWVDEITKRGIKDIMPEWTGKKYLQLINIGAIQIQNDEFRELYLKRWNDFRKYIENNRDNLNYKFTKGDTVEYTTLASQYIITELVEHYNIKAVDLKPFKAYKHYVGKQKFTNNLVPYDKVLIFNNKASI